MPSEYEKTKTSFGEASEDKLGKCVYDEFTDSDEQAALLLRTFNLEGQSKANSNDKSQSKLP